MNSQTKHKLVWGWLRLFLGFLQMSLVGLSVGSLIAVGLHTVTYLFVGGATLAAITSLLLYRRRADPLIKGLGGSSTSREVKPSRC